MRTRRDVYKLGTGDQTLHWYGLAIDRMRQKAASDPTSWLYQGAVHGTSPVSAAHRRFWAQCQHGSAFFLPWHRMYLLRFERIVAAEVAALGGPADWALPYWNYSTNAAHRALPPEFRSPTDSNGNPNPLYVAQRSAAANAGQTILGPRDVDLSRCLTAPGTTLGGGFFGGMVVAHFGGMTGMLESVPHNAVHVRVGGSGGWMANPNHAALDPIFWLHHANIDRLWEVWLARDPNNQNLAAAYWRTGVPFDFHDESGNVVTMKTADVLNLADPSVDYRYDDVSDPLTPPTPPGPSPSAASPAPGGSSVTKTTDGELAGATLAPVDLDTAVQHVDVPTPVVSSASASVSSASAASGPPKPPRMVLVLEHVRSDALAPTYDVYVNVPDAEDPAAHDDCFAGRAALFGIKEASDPGGQHAGAGQTLAFDISEIYERIANAPGFDASKIRVSFVPVDPEQGTRVSVGRIGLYVS